MCGGFIGDVLGGIGDVVEGVVDAVSDLGSSIDDFVNDVIPGGWLGVGAGALLAVGIYNPTLLGLAEEGALTAEALAAEGIDAAALATEVAAVTPEAAAAAAEAADLAAGIGAVSPEAANLVAATQADLAAGLGEFAGTDAAVAANAAAAAAAPLATTEAVLAAADPGLLSSLGLGGLSTTQIAGMVAAGLLAPTVLGALGLGGKGGGDAASDTGTFVAPHVNIPQLAQGGINPGMLPIKPAYATTNDVQSQYDWGRQPYVANATDLAARQNAVPSTTTHGWGLQQAQQPFDVNAFIAQTINPAAAAALAGAPFPAAAPVAPVAPTTV